MAAYGAARTAQAEWRDAACTGKRGRGHAVSAVRWPQASKLKGLRLGRLK